MDFLMCSWISLLTAPPSLGGFLFLNPHKNLGNLIFTVEAMTTQKPLA